MQPKPTVTHIIFVNGTVYHQFLDAEWYDTATPYQGCVRDLRRLYDLAATTPLEILSHGTRYAIINQTDFQQWVAGVFEGGMALGFAQRLK